MISKTKRLMLPRVVKVPRKEFFWGPSSRAGKHPRNSSVPLLTVLRDYIHLGDKEREITRILTSGQIYVDGRKVKDRRYAVGFMDLITIPGQEASFRIIFNSRGNLAVGKEKPEMADMKLLKVRGKRTIEGGKLQLGFHDGTNVITDNSAIKPGDVVKFSLSDRKIVSVYPMAKGSRVYLTGGSHIGAVATIKEIEVKNSSRANLVMLEEGYGTLADYSFVISGNGESYEIPEVMAP